jgi:adenine-specific DNA-methyltransferase
MLVVSLKNHFQKTNLLEEIELLRFHSVQRLSPKKRKEYGQFFTPLSLAQMMAALVKNSQEHVSILDAGAGVGALFAACVSKLCQRKRLPLKISVVAYEIDSNLIDYLSETFNLCRAVCEKKGIIFAGEIRNEDFIGATSQKLNETLFSKLESERFNIAILNPPYRKINSNSETRRSLSSIGIETTNLYTGFLAAAIKLLEENGELIAITPRSFCNGSYFRPFREFLLEETALTDLHLFDSRQNAFSDDGVLQETIIFRAVKTPEKPIEVSVSSSEGINDEMLLARTLKYEEVVLPGDPEKFIRILSDSSHLQTAHRMNEFVHKLQDLGIQVSTGKVVDFRAKEYLRQLPESNTAPLVYPTNLEEGRVKWVKKTKKPQAIMIAEETRPALIPNDNYVLVKRFTSKEERKRVVSVVFEAKQFSSYEVIGFENHLNYFHRNGRGVDLDFARGLSAFLNSTAVDTYFRQFNGHTQVNATDLRNLKYPSIKELTRLGQKLPLQPTQEEIDELLESELLKMNETAGKNPIVGKTKIDEALQILVSLGLPRAQLNERSALTLLALLNLEPSDSWSQATSRMIGITPIMDFMAEKYGKVYKPNTRETVRRQTMHQFLEAALVMINPDKPDRPPNSPKTVYEVAPDALQLIRTFGTEEWVPSLQTYLASVETLKRRYAQEREMARIPVEVADSKVITLSPGGQNVLVKEIIDEFAPRFTPGGKLLYVGDTDEKWAHFDQKALADLDVSVDEHGKIPDVIIHYTDKNWLVLIEAVTSHGPIDPKRKSELERIFAGSTAGLVFVTAFLTRRAMIEYISQISWETEVWVADAPSHLIHFNGEKFLGPY